MTKQAEESTLKFWANDHAENYKKGVREELNDKEVTDQWVRKILENAPDKEKLRILDIGTGPGFFTINFTKLGHEVTGVDVTPDMIRVAKENAAEQGVECDFQIMNANSLDFPDNTFDLIISRNVTWTLPDLFECYREWRRALAPNGRAIVFDSNHYINLFDEEQADIMHRSMRDHLIKGIEDYSDYYDFHVRWTYWEERPMVGTPRPLWDKNMLFKLRYTNIIAEDFSANDYDSRGTSGPQFIIVAEKPAPLEENNYIVNEYWNGISGCESARAFKSIEDGSAKKYVESIASNIAGKKILDLGTGSGEVAIELARKGFDVVGIDRAYAMIDMAKLTAEEQKIAVDFKVDDGESLSFEDGSFDSVIIRNTMWCSFEPEKMLTEAYRVLRNGGSLIITDGNVQKDISEWKAANPDSDLLPDYKRRNLGLGAFDVIDQYYAKLPLNNEQRPVWDSEKLKSFGASVVVCKEFDDPMVSADLKDILKSGFIVVASK